MVGLLPLEDAEDVDPEEAAGPDVDDPEAGRDEDEVDRLGWEPEHAGALECRDQLLSGHRTW